jgi:ATP-dependent helicase/nuclease subunit B
MKIITGRAKTGKSTYIYDEIYNEINNNSSHNLILIVPDLMTYQAEYDIIQRLNSDGIMNVEVLSFKRIASKILEEVGGLRLQDINIYGKIMLLKKIFDENADELNLFKKSSNQEGFLREFNLLIQELKQNLVSPASLEDVSKDIENPLLKSKLHDIQLIYSKYSEKTLDKYYDEEDKYELVISMIKDSNYIKNSKIWIDGFESFNHQRLMIIKNLVEYSKSVTISLNIDSAYLDDLESFDDWEAFKTIYDTFASLREAIGDDIEIVPLTECKNPTKEISLIERNLFSIKADEVCENTDRVNLYSSLNPYTEIERTAIKIVSLVRDHGYRWKDIKVAVGAMNSYEINIRKVFDKFEIPYFLDVKRDILNSPVSRYILSLLDMFIWNFKYENVFEFLKTGLSHIGKNKIETLENYALQYGIEGSKWFERIDDNKTSYIEEIRSTFISDFESEIHEFKNLSTISEITNFIFKYLKKHKVREKVQIKIDQFKKENNYESSSEYSQVWNHIIEVFEQILLVGEDLEISPIEYRRVLEAGFKEVQISIIPPTIDTVEIGDISRVAVNSPKALFILGANEGNFDVSNEMGLLFEDEREVLIDRDIKLLNGPTFAYFKDKHMLYKAFSSPTERLYISYALGTTDGNSLQPSLYLDTLKRIFPSLKEETDISVNDELEYVSNSKGTYDYLIENIRKYMNGIEIDDVWKSVYNWYKNNDAERFNLIKQGFNFENSIEKVEPSILKNIYDNEINITVSKLETYAECHFKYFVENVLKPKPRLTQKIEYYDLGNINHNVLEDFLNTLIENYEKIDSLSDEEIGGLINDSIDRVLEEMSKKVTALDVNSRNKYLKRKIQRVLNRTAFTLVTHLKRSEYKPMYTELQIGVVDEKDEKVQKGIYLDNVDIKIDDQIIKLRGKIDRVDVFKDEKDEVYVSIIDYKSSGKDIDLLDALEGLQIQLLVYLNAIVQNGHKLFGKKPKVGGVFYYHVDDPIIKKQCDNLEDEILKELKLKGYALKDKKLIKKMDNTLGPKVSSNIIPASFKLDEEFSQNSKVLTQDEFEKLLLFIHEKCKELTIEILSGNFEMNPYQKSGGNKPCTYCDYIGICKFDKDMGNQYRTIKGMKQTEALNEILTKGGELKDGVDEGAKANN